MQLLLHAISRNFIVTIIMKLNPSSSDKNLSDIAWREIHFSATPPNLESSFPKNIVRISRFTAKNLVFKSIKNQLKQPANLWTLLVTILQASVIGIWSAYSFSTILPLTLLILLNLSVDAYEDLKKHQKYKDLNSTPAQIWNGNTYETKPCEEIRVGNLVLVHRNEEVPADLIAICFAPNKQKCLVDMSHLVGGMDYSIKKPVKDTQFYLDSNDVHEISQLLTNLKFTVRVNDPVEDYTKFGGKLKIQNFPQASKLSEENLLLRGSKVKCEWILGFVVYTGMECNLYYKNIHTEAKASMLEKQLKKITLVFLGILVLLVAFSLFIRGLLTNIMAYSFLSDLCYSILNFNYLVPLPLFLVLDLLKLLRVNSLSGLLPRIRFNTLKFNENFGRVDYLLTENSNLCDEDLSRIGMCAIGENTYPKINSFYDEKELSYLNRGLSPESDSLIMEDEVFNFSGEVQKDPNFSSFVQCVALSSPSVSMESPNFSREENLLLENFLQHLGVSISVSLKARKEVTLQIGPDKFFYRVVAHQNFESNSNKVRVVVEDLDNGMFYLYVRGPQEEMTSIFQNNPLINNTIEINAREFFTQRIIMYGYSTLSSESLDEFLKLYKNAKLSPLDPEASIESVFELFEQDLVYLGSVGIKENISEKTKKSVQSLKKAGVSIWLLSGNRKEVCQSAAVSSGIIENSMPTLEITGETIQDCTFQLENMIENFLFYKEEEGVHTPITRPGRKKPTTLNNESGISESEFLKPTPEPARKRSKKSTIVRKYHPLVSSVIDQPKIDFVDFKRKVSLRSYNLLVTGEALETCFSAFETKVYLSVALFCAESVTFCNFSLYQKKQVARLLKDYDFRPVSLGIFRSEGELGMVKECDLAVALENTNNSKFADLADACVQSFSSIEKITIHEGFKNLVNFRKAVVLFIYMSFLLSSVGLFYGFEVQFNSNNGMRVLDSVIYIASCFPLVMVGLFDESLPKSQLKEWPAAYNYSRLLRLGFKEVAYAFLEAFVHSSCIFYVLKLSMQSVINAEGFAEDSDLIGFCLASGVYFAITIKILLSTEAFRFQTIVGHVVSFVLLMVFLCLRSFGAYQNSYQMLGVLETAFSSPRIILYPVLVSCLNFLVSYSAKYLRTSLFPSIVCLIKQKQYLRTAGLNFSKLQNFVWDVSKVYKPALKRAIQKQKDQFKIETKNLRFKSDKIEKDYSNERLSQNLKKYKITMFLILGISLSFQVWAYPYIKLVVSIGLLIAINGSKLVILLYITFSSILEKHTLLIANAYGLYILGVLTAISVDIPEISPIIFSLNPVLFYMALYVTWSQATILNILSFGVVVINSYVYFDEQGYQGNNLVFRTLYFNILFLAINISSGIIAYQQNYSGRQNYALTKITQKETEKARNVLNYLFPKFIAPQVLKNEELIAENQSSVTIVFCNICEFHEIVESFSPQELTAFLDLVFRKFDRLCKLHGVSKIETVGYTYMACSGITHSEKELEIGLKSVPQARRAVNLAVAMLKEAEGIFWMFNKPLKLKIGVNTGSVTAGVVGYQKPQFALVGDTVNTSSRMASTLKYENAIQISDATYQDLGDYSSLQFEVKEVEVKGKGKMKTFIVYESSSSRINNLVPEYLTGVNSGQNDLETMNTSLGRARLFRSSFYNTLQIEQENELLRMNSEIVDTVKFFTLKCVDTQAEKEFRVETIKNFLTMYKLGNLIFFSSGVLTILGLLTEYILMMETAKIVEAVQLVVWFGILGGILCMMKNYWQRLWFAWTIQLLILLILTVYIIRFTIDDFTPENGILSFLYIILLLSHYSFLFLKNVLGTVLFAYLGIIVFEIAKKPLNLFNMIMTTFYLIIILITVYFREKQFRIFSIIKSNLTKQLSQTESLLKRMLPAHVYDNLKEESVTTDKFSDMTMLYADIVGFTSWSSDKLPEEVLGMLSHMFKEFDEACVKNQVYKVHTIGDCYVVLGNTGEGRNPPQECCNVIEFAKDMIRIIQEINEIHRFELNMRIGVHTGDVIGGISGTNIVRYDIYGGDVLIANKIESEGVPGRISVSESTKDILEGTSHYSFEPHKLIDVKELKTSVQTFLVRS